MTNLLCLSFLQLMATPVFIPQQVDQLVKNRIKQQFESTHPSTTLSFDDKNCPLQGTYEFTADSIVLAADHSEWSGRFEGRLSDLIDGRHVDFPHAGPPEIPPIPTPVVVASPSRIRNFTGLLPGLLTALGVTLLGAIVKNRTNSNEPRLVRLSGL